MNSFTTQWRKDNIRITYEKGVLFKFFIRLFFKTWFAEKQRDTNFNIIIKSGKGKIKGKLFDYNRAVGENEITTTLENVKLFRAFIRSIYKTIMNKANVVGVPELYMSAIRTTILEPIEFYFCSKGWTLIHANVFRFQGKICVITAGSKVGKSTLIKRLYSKHKVDILSDNYCFVNGSYVKTVEEPLRGGNSSRKRLTFYNRSISGYPTTFEGEIDYFFVLRRTDHENEVSLLSEPYFSQEVNKINKQAKEGIFYLSKKDPLAVKDKEEVLFKGSYKKYDLKMKNGIENIDEVINLLINKMK